MREIVFRGKRVDNGEWIEGGYFDGSRFPMIVPHIRLTDFINKYTTFDGHEVVRETVGQSTGLKDKNGTTIFEDDIVRYGDSLHKVVFENRSGTAYFGIVIDSMETWSFGYSVPADQMEIVGNIHDNPKLIQGA